MIWLTRLNRAPLVLNSDLIEHIETTPDTVITLTNGQILRVRETAEDVVRRIIEFRRRIASIEHDPADLCRRGQSGSTHRDHQRSGDGNKPLCLPGGGD